MGLTVVAHLVEQVYQKGIKVTEEAMAALNITYHEICPQWNYTIHPKTVVPTA